MLAAVGIFFVYLGIGLIGGLALGTISADLAIEYGATLKKRRRIFYGIGLGVFVVIMLVWWLREEVYAL